MKIFLVLCMVILVITAVSSKKQSGKYLKKVYKECQKNNETRVDNQILKKIKKNMQVTLPDNYGAHSLCILKGLGYINEDATINEEKLKKKVAKKAEQDEVDDIVLECSVAEDTPEETALHLEKCLRSHKIEPCPFSRCIGKFANKTIISLITTIFMTSKADDPHGLGAAHKKCHVGAPEVEPKPASSSESSSHEGHHGEKAEHHIEKSKCLAKELGLVNDEGKIIVGGVKLHVGHVITDGDKIEEIVKTCAQEKDSADATAGHVVKCLYEKHVFAHEGKHHGSSESDESDSSGHHHHHHHQHHHDDQPKPAVAPAGV
ncbi:uncharacterized protein [Euwallacea similis]|uniref:uncharacterized protein n=1 Tax=Euwallacea similis TaxID=1736056 RepID=UPI00344FAB89